MSDLGNRSQSQRSLPWQLTWFQACNHAGIRSYFFYPSLGTVKRKQFPVCSCVGLSYCRFLIFTKECPCLEVTLMGAARQCGAGHRCLAYGIQWRNSSNDVYSKLIFLYSQMLTFKNRISQFFHKCECWITIHFQIYFFLTYKFSFPMNFPFSGFRPKTGF